MVAIFLLYVGGKLDVHQNYPVATKCVVRAMIKAAELCSSAPQRAARILMDKKDATEAQYDAAIEALTEIPPHEAGWIRSTPQEITGQAADRSFLAGRRSLPWSGAERKVQVGEHRRLGGS